MIEHIKSWESAAKFPQQISDEWNISSSRHENCDDSQAKPLLYFRRTCTQFFLPGQAIPILCPTRQMPSLSEDVSFSAATWRIELPPHYRQRTDSSIWLQDIGSSVCSDLKSFCAGAANTVFLRNIATAIPSLWFSRLESLIPHLASRPLTRVIWLNYVEFVSLFMPSFVQAEKLWLNQVK